MLAWILMGLAAIHIYWAAGGTWGATQAIPKLPGGREPLFVPGPVATLAVAGLLLLAAAISAGVFLQDHRLWLMRAMALAFALRAVGEFRYTSFFKRVRDTDFAYSDTRLFSPLCAAMAALAWFY